MAPDSVDLLPYILLPITGPEELSEEETLSLPESLQLLPPDKKRDPSVDIIITHLETLMLLTTTREVRAKMREVGVYPLVRELHLAVEDDEVREQVERLVGVLQRDEEGEETAAGGEEGGVAEVREGGGFAAVDDRGKVEEDEDDRLIEIV